MKKLIIILIVLLIAILYFSSSQTQPLDSFKNELHKRISERFDFNNNEEIFYKVDDEPSRKGGTEEKFNSIFE